MQYEIERMNNSLGRTAATVLALLLMAAPVLAGGALEPRELIVRELGQFASADLAQPIGMARDGDGNLYVADTGHGRVVKLGPDGRLERVLGAGKLDLPADVALAPDGSVYVADTMNHRIVQFDLDGAYEGSFGRFGAGPGELRHPWGVAVGPGGSVWVGDMTNGRLQQFAADGTLIGAYSADFDHPKGVDVDARGVVAVGVTGGHAVDLLTHGVAP